jgi:hypothetical protein
VNKGPLVEGVLMGKEESVCSSTRHIDVITDVFNLLQIINVISTSFILKENFMRHYLQVASFRARTLSWEGSRDPSCAPYKVAPAIDQHPEEVRKKNHTQTPNNALFTDHGVHERGLPGLPSQVQPPRAQQIRHIRSIWIRRIKFHNSCRSRLVERRTEHHHRSRSSSSNDRGIDDDGGNGRRHGRVRGGRASWWGDFGCRRTRILCRGDDEEERRL